jgi:hypothetical protein
MDEDLGTIDISFVATISAWMDANGNEKLCYVFSDVGQRVLTLSLCVLWVPLV